VTDKVKVCGDISIPSDGKILVDLPQGLGDQIMCFPLFVSLKKVYPSIEITAFTLNGGSAELLKKNSRIHSVMTIPFVFSLSGLMSFFIHRYPEVRRFFIENCFSCVIVVHKNLFRTILYRLLPVRCLVYNLENIHKTRECANILDVLGVPLVCDYSLDTLGDESILEKNGLKKKGYILLDLYAQHLERDPRQWPGFGGLIDLLNNKGFTVAAVGINRAHSRDPRVVDFVNRTSFSELLGLIRNAKLVVAHDSGIFHFSYSLGTQVIGLYGPVDPKDRVPCGENKLVHTIYYRQNCSPCIKNRVDIECVNADRGACMNSITPDEVMAAIETILSN
jgi:ADP-heptose:LPS heptosyltransferase